MPRDVVKNFGDLNIPKLYNSNAHVEGRGFQLLMSLRTECHTARTPQGLTTSTSNTSYNFP